MSSLTFPGAGGPAVQRDDDAQWQRACNEGWPDRQVAMFAAPLGQVAPAIAMPAASNVVRLDLWQARQRTRAAAAQ